MIIPMVSSLSEDVLSAVPRGLREAAYGLGATKFEVSTRIVVPAGLSGVVASFILAISRAVGETMAVVLAAGMHPADLTLNPLASVETMTAYIVAVDRRRGVVRDRPKYLSLFAVGLVLFLHHAGLEYRVGPGAASLPGGLRMSRARPTPALRVRQRPSPAGWARCSALACFLATLTGVVVLSALLGSIVVRGAGQASRDPLVRRRRERSSDLVGFLSG